MKKNDARAESALKHVPEWNGDKWINTPNFGEHIQAWKAERLKADIKKLTEYLRTMVYYHHHPDNKNWDLIGEAEELVMEIEVEQAKDTTK